MERLRGLWRNGPMDTLTTFDTATPTLVTGLTGAAGLTGTPRALTVTAAVGAALVAGVFFAFSTFVMPALRRLPDTQGIEAMQSINRAAPASGLFMGALFGTGLLSVGLAVWALRDAGAPYAKYLLAGCALYLVCIVLTGAYHVPHNNALAELDPTGAGAAQTWHRYVTGWTALNHLRVLGPLAAGVSYVLALRSA